jgi:hypothetical protein
MYDIPKVAQIIEIPFRKQRIRENSSLKKSARSQPQSQGKILTIQHMFALSKQLFPLNPKNHCSNYVSKVKNKKLTKVLI